MLLELDFSHETPIYLQIRNQVVMGIADGRLAAGERLPTIRALAREAGINMMTANKAYALLKQEGYIQTDRRSGVTVRAELKSGGAVPDRIRSGLRLLIAEAKLGGAERRALLDLCGQIYDEMEETE
ncbi:MAG: GntR family transcriptional regulator [Oscillospiraceae bacterium]|nr:GntR family transcriptional regulator [Oscillospiraceae bacterium]